MRAVRALEIGELGADGLRGRPQHDLERGLGAEAADRELDLKHLVDLLEDHHGLHFPDRVGADTDDGEGDLGHACDKSGERVANARALGPFLGPSSSSYRRLYFSVQSRDGGTDFASVQGAHSTQRSGRAVRIFAWGSERRTRRPR